MNENEITQNKFQNISNQELLKEVMRRVKKRMIAEDEWLLAWSTSRREELK